MLRERWFFEPALALATMVAIHATDIQPGLIRGIRDLGLSLLSWLLPVLAVIVALFLASLLVVSVAPLWATHFAGKLLLTTCAVLIVLINCAYQDGSTERTAPWIKRAAIRLAAGCLLPLAGLALWALTLRVRQYGWTPDRVFAAALILTAACYAIGYLAAMLRRGNALRLLETTNATSAYIILATILALFSPLADPARIMVANQIARLRAGTVSIDKFDFLALRLDGARWGDDALRAMANAPDAAEATRARQALVMTQRWQANVPTLPGAADIAQKIALLPDDRKLPDALPDPAFWIAEFSNGLACLRPGGEKCAAVMVRVGPGPAESLKTPSPAFAAPTPPARRQCWCRIS